MTWGGALLMPIINAQIRKIIQSGGGDASAELKHFISGTAPATFNITEDYFEGSTYLPIGKFNSNLSINSVAVPATISDISSYVFQNSSIVNLVIRGKITTSSDFLCAKCANLQTVLIEGTHNGTVIPSRAFENCPSLVSITIKTPNVLALASINAFNSGSGGTNPNFKVYVPANLVDSYKTATNWSTYADHIEAIVE